MSSLLYRLGRWCATHAWRTLTIWLVVLVGLGVLAGTVGKPLTSQISIPGTTFQKVIDGLGGEIPEAAGGVGTVVLQSTDGSAITDEQRAAAEEVFATWAEVPHVKRVIDPFEAQDESRPERHRPRRRRHRRSRRARPSSRPGAPSCSRPRGS